MFKTNFLQKKKGFWWIFCSSISKGCEKSDKYYCGSLEKMFLQIDTGCSNWTLSKVNGCGTKTVHIWPYVDKAKMCLRGSSFFQFFKTFAFSVVCLHFFQWNTTSQMHFGFTNMGSNMHRFSVTTISFWLFLYRLNYNFCQIWGCKIKLHKL